MLEKYALKVIDWYQHTLSPDHGPLKGHFPFGYCRFGPTCSDYAKQAIKKYGLAKGIALGGWRIVRCNPWSRGGYDSIE